MASDTSDTRPVRARGRRIPFRYWVIIILAVLTAIFIAQNTEHHPVHLLWVTIEASTWLVLTVVLVAGVVIGLLLRRRRR